VEVVPSDRPPDILARNVEMDLEKRGTDWMSSLQEGETGSQFQEEFSVSVGANLMVSF
jgi:hypothetical protein